MRPRTLFLGAAFALFAVAFLGAVWLAGVQLRSAWLRGATFDPMLRGSAWQRDALVAMSEYFPSRTIARAEPVSELPREPRPLADLRYGEGDAEASVADFLERNHTHGIVVLHRGRLVFERYFDGADAGSRFTSFSVAKSFTATQVGQLLGDGAIESLDDPLEKYLPRARGTAYEGVRIEDVLTMSSGVRFDEGYGSLFSDVARYFTAAAFAQVQHADALALRYPRAAPPGTRFNYNTAETQVLGRLVRKASGRSQSALLEERIWRPLGMEHDASWLLDRSGPDGVELGGCCLNAALRDWARFGQLHLQDGVWQGRRLLPEGWVARATRQPDGEASDAARHHYRYQWWTLGDGTYTAEGVYGQFIWVDPEHQVVIAKASAWPVAWSEALADDAFAAFSAVARHLAGTEPAPGG